MTAHTRALIEAEQLRQDDLGFAGTFPAMTPERILAVLTEEIGEVARATLDLHRPPSIHPDAARRRHQQLQEEIVHVAATAAAWLDDCFPENTR